MKRVLQQMGIGVVMAYIAAAVFGLLPIVGMGHGAMAHEAGCPYADGTQAMCDMGFSHIRGWQTFSSASISTFVLLLALAVTFVAPLARTVLTSGRVYLGLRRRRVSILRTMYQELFSSGILHPKNP